MKNFMLALAILANSFVSQVAYAVKSESFDAVIAQAELLPDLSFKSVMREFYTEKMVKTFVSDKDIEAYPNVGLSDADTSKNTVALMHPIVSYKNHEKSDRYLVLIEKVQVDDDGVLVICHVCDAEADLYIFKKTDQEQYQLVSLTKESMVWGSFGRSVFEATEIKKNIHFLGKKLTGSFIENSYTATGVTEFGKYALHLSESDFIDIYDLAATGTDNTLYYSENSPLAYSYHSTVEINKTDDEYFPVTVTYSGEKPNKKEKIVPLRTVKKIVFNPSKQCYIDTKYKTPTCATGE